MQIKMFTGKLKSSLTLESKVNNFIKGKSVVNIVQSVVKDDSLEKPSDYEIVITVLYKEQ